MNQLIHRLRDFCCWIRQKIKKNNQNIVMGDFVKLKYPKIYNIYNEAYSFYDSQIVSINNLQADNIEESIFKQILLQFSVIAKQDLESIFILFQNKHFYTPQIILRSLVEYVITLAYIEKEPEKYSKQYVLQGIKSNISTLNAMKNSNVISFHDSYEKRLAELKKEEKKYGTDIHGWLQKLEARAQKTNLESFYFVYRYLSMLAHPNPNNTNYFFKDEPDKIIFYDFNEDNTFRTLLFSLLLTNVLMSKVNESFQLKDSEKYDELNDRIKHLFSKNKTII